jgi:hypothetical protein
MAKAVCFPHADDQFKTPNKLMEWLDYSLRYIHDGYYRYRTAPGLGSLEPGSLVFFYKSGLIVGSAVVEKAPRPLERAEIERCNEVYGLENNCAGMHNIVKFFKNSIWVWSEHSLISRSEFKEITGNDLTHYVTIKSEDILRLYEVVARKSAEMEARV